MFILLSLTIPEFYLLSLCFHAHVSKTHIYIYSESSLTPPAASLDDLYDLFAHSVAQLVPPENLTSPAVRTSPSSPHFTFFPLLYGFRWHGNCSVTL